MMEIIFLFVAMSLVAVLMAAIIHPDVQTGIVCTSGLALMVMGTLGTLGDPSHWRMVCLTLLLGALMTAIGFWMQWRRVHRRAAPARRRREEDLVKVFLTPGR